MDSALNFYFMIVSYDGTAYHGWQQQDDYPSIEGTLRTTFKKVFARELPRFLGASRTDAGVHALGQAVRFATDIPLDPEKIRTVWNGALPDDIVILSIKKAPENFHPHQNIEQKTYWYHFATQPLLPFAQRYAWYFRYPVDLEKLNQALQVFVGTHDFSSFATEIGENNPVRRIDSITIEFAPEWGAHRIVVKGPSFLRYMIRRIVGACLKVASNDHLAIDVLRAALAARNPHQELPSAAARGLCLHHIDYKEQHF